MTKHYQKAYFLLSVADVKQLPADKGIEIAIVGRSNVGKSSILNQITQNKKLARVSKTPGRTQFINFFALDQNRRLADLPGYGYAKVPPVVKSRWQKTIEIYLRQRKSLQGMLLIMDIRHPFKEQDLQLLNYCQSRDMPVHIILNKADKLSTSQVSAALKQSKATLTSYQNSVTVQSFSTKSGTGIQALHKLLDQWYSGESC